VTQFTRVNVKYIHNWSNPWPVRNSMPHRSHGLLILTLVTMAGCPSGSGTETGGNKPPTTNPPQAQTVPLTVTIDGSGRVADASHGLSCASSCQADFEVGTTVSLSATPDSGSRFDGWGGACAGIGQCDVVLDTAKSVSAHFAPLDPGAGSPAGDSLYENIASPGKVTVTLHPGSQVVLGQTTRVAFGVPFPRNVLPAVDDTRVVDASGAEIASAALELSRWRSIAPTGPESIRAALFYVDIIFEQRIPRTLEVQFGRARSLLLDSTLPEVTNLWTAIANGPDPDEYPASDGVREPIVYVTLPPEWLVTSLLVTRSTVVGTTSGLDWWDTGLVNFARTAVNDVAPTVTANNLIDLSVSEPWLYDRALTLFSVYIRTGDIEWLRRAHRATQWYGKHVDGNGIFTLASYNHDLKYSYGLSLLIDFLLTGDDALSGPVERVANAGMREWSATYSSNTGFWTERHHTYALLAALSAFELSGNPDHASRATSLVNLILQMSQNTAQCPLHTVEQHEGDAGDTRLMCSPWMNALLAEAMLRYYILSEDPNILTWLSGIGDYLSTYAVYDGGIESAELSGLKMPWYLAGTDSRVEDGRGWDDMEHACDVAGLGAKSVWAKRRLGLDYATTEAMVDDLLVTCRFVLDYWHRSTPELAEYRLSPPRKFSWWFGSSTDLAWMLNR